MQDIKIQLRLYEHLDALRARGYEPIYLALCGSQNYNLDTEESDIDTKAIIIPSLKDIALSKEKVSFTCILENNEHIDVKDIRTMFNTIFKQNINYLEILFTKYYWVDENYKLEIEMLRAMAEEIAHYDIQKAINSISGQAHSRYIGLERKEEIDKGLGYNPKYLLRICREREFLERYIAGESYSDILITNHRDYLLKIKEGHYSLDQARTVAKIEIDTIHNLMNKIENNYEKNEEIKNKVDSIIYDIFVKKIKKEIEK